MGIKNEEFLNLEGFWNFPDGPQTCPGCNTPTVVTKIPTLLSGSLSSKGGGKSSWIHRKVRYCPRCYQERQDQLDAEYRSGQMYNLKEIIDALEEDREPRTNAEMYPDKFPMKDKES